MEQDKVFGPGGYQLIVSNPEQRATVNKALVKLIKAQINIRRERLRQRVGIRFRRVTNANRATG